MAIHLVRHATAASRPDWHQSDDLRPLTSAGLAQASTIADALVPFDVRRILSSRSARCTQTMQPLADKLGLSVDIHRALAEEASVEDVWSLVETIAATGTESVLCSHGNVIPPVLDRLHRRGVVIDAVRWSCHKGSIWTLQVDGGEVVRAVHTLERA